MIAASNLTAERLHLAVATRPGAGYRALQQHFTYLAPEPLADVSSHVILDKQVEHVCVEAGTAMLGTCRCCSVHTPAPTDRFLTSTTHRPPTTH